MEYVNVDAVKLDGDMEETVRHELLDSLSEALPDDVIVTTDSLELLAGETVLQKARAMGRQLVPLRRVSPMRARAGFPKRVLLELTSRCNSYCTMCPRNVLTRPEMDMDTDVAKRVIREMGEVGLSGLWLYNIGESLLHPDFFEILKVCREYDSLGTIWLSTNGEILDEAVRKRLLETPVDILNFSVNAMTEESFTKVTPNLNFERVQNNLKAIIKERGERDLDKPIIRVQMVEMDFVQEEVERFFDEFGSQADIVSINKLEEFSQNVDQVSSGDIELNERVACCNRLEREDFFVFSNGSVSCCDTDFNCALNIGNVNEATLSEVFSGAAYAELLESYKNGRLHENPLCAKCRDFSL